MLVAIDGVYATDFRSEDGVLGDEERVFLTTEHRPLVVDVEDGDADERARRSMSTDADDRRGDVELDVTDLFAIECDLRRHLAGVSVDEESS